MGKQSRKPTKSDAANMLWWQKGIIYEIYIRSFQDSNGDGIGDLRGIINRLDYLQDLGVDILWVTPFYKSPMHDFGYDIADYKSVDTMFGTMEDFDELLAETHKRGMKLILDQVPNHCSNEHEWFQEARKSKSNPKRDWFIWHDGGENGGEPNNWKAMFGGSAWEYDEKTKQYYYHAFLKEQPDLNWRNPEVQQAVLKEMKFWLDKGVDGFRVDVMWHLIKDEFLRDNPENKDYKPEQPTYNQLLPVYSTDQPEVHKIVEMMRKLTDKYKERVLIGEIYLSIHQLVNYYGYEQQGAHLPFNFLLLSKPWDPKEIAVAIDEYEGALPNDGWPNWVLGNHDQSRMATDIGKEQARVAAVLLLTLRGTPTLYYGDEIGMPDVEIPQEEWQDPQGLLMPDKALSRDPFRSPMPWDDSRNAGFSTGKPWLRMAKNAKKNNVKTQQEDTGSLLTLYKRLIKLRKQEPALHAGIYRPVYSDKQLLVYLRETDRQRYLIVLNLSNKDCKFAKENFSFRGEIRLATNAADEGRTVETILNLKKNDGWVVKLER